MSRATLYLVRHAKAGERRAWDGDDILRPLSAAGWRQADAIGKRLAKHGATAAISSPYVRCVQTLEPLADRIGLDGVGTDGRLLEGADFEGVLDLLHEAAPGTVLCSHGDIVPAVIKALARRGMQIQNDPDWRKGTIWVLQRDPRHIGTGKVWPPPPRAGLRRSCRRSRRPGRPRR